MHLNAFAVALCAFEKANVWLLFLDSDFVWMLLFQTSLDGIESMRVTFEVTSCFFVCRAMRLCLLLL